MRIKITLMFPGAIIAFLLFGEISACMRIPDTNPTLALTQIRQDVLMTAKQTDKSGVSKAPTGKDGALCPGFRLITAGILTR